MLLATCVVVFIIIYTALVTGALADDFLRISGDQFTLNGTIYHLKGSNYYPASAPWAAWFDNWNWTEITTDVDRLRSLGINCVRINLPYSAGSWGGPNVNQGHLDKLERLVEYLRYRGMKANITLFDWETSFPAAGTTTEANHKQYIATIVNRLKNNPGVFLWDVKNEPDHPSNIGGYDNWDYNPTKRDQIVSWISRMCAYIRSLQSNQYAAAGIRWWQNISDVINYVDVAIFHSYWTNIDTQEIPETKAITSKPILVQEFGWPSQPHPAWRGTYWQYDFTEADQLSMYQIHLNAFTNHNIAGCIQWQACDLAAYVADPNNNKDVSFENYFGLWRLGGALKPAATYYRDNFVVQFFPYSDSTVPANPTNVTAGGGDRQVTLSFTHSASPDCAGTMIRYKTTGYPASPTDGYLVAEIAGEGKSSNAYQHTGLQRGTTYYYTVFAYDYARNYSTGVQVSATTLSQPDNLLVGPGIDTFAGGVAEGWTAYERYSSGNSGPIQFAADTSLYYSNNASQKISGIGCDALPNESGGYAYAGIMQSVAAVPGKVYMMVAKEKMTAPTGSPLYFRTFGINPYGVTDPGEPGPANVAGAQWMGPNSYCWNSDPEASNTSSSWYTCLASIGARASSISCWAGLGVSRVSGRLAADKMNYDAFYLHCFENPVNASLTNAGAEGAIFECNDAGQRWPQGWLPCGGGCGLFVGYSVDQSLNGAHSGSKYVTLKCKSGRCEQGLMQRVLTYPGEALTASAWFKGSSSNAATTTAYIGIDPLGGDDMFSGSVVWTQYNVGASATWTQVNVSTIAQANAATVYIRASSGNNTAGFHTVYFDDAAFTARTKATKPASLRDIPDGRPVTLDDVIVTGKFTGASDYFYVEDAARTSGIKVVASTTAAVGQRVDISGTMSTADGERCLINNTVSIDTGNYAVPRPFAIPIAGLGGASGGAYTPGVNGAYGPYNVGLLVRTWGRVLTSTSTHFVINDGGSRNIKVYSSSQPSVGKYVGVSGVSCCEIPQGSSTPISIIRTRSSSDVQVYN